MFPGKLLGEGLGEQCDIASSFSERRSVNRKYIETIVQVLTEISILDRSKQVSIGRRDHTYIDLNRLVASDALEFPFLQHAQQLCLNLR